MPATVMEAWAVDRPGPIDDHPLARVQRPVPEPGPGQVRLRVSACGVCRTDLHLAEGDLAPSVPAWFPVTRWWAWSISSVRAPIASSSGRGSVCRGWRVPAASAGSASPTGRTSASRRCSPAGTSTAATPTTRWSTRTSPTPSPKASATTRQPPCSVPGSSATGPSAGPGCRRRPAGHLRLRGFGAPGRPDRHGRGGARPRPHTGTGRSPIGPAARGGQRRRCRRRATRAAGCRHPLRTGGHAGAPGARGPGARGTLAIAGIHLSDIPPLNYQRHLFEERDLCSVTANTARTARSSSRPPPAYRCG